MLEKEYKQLISKQTYLNLSNIFEWDNKITQTNYYYMDKDAVLLDNKITVRIREIDNLLKLQIKVPQNINRGLHEKIEYEKVVSDIPNELDNLFVNNCIQKNLSKLELIGKMTTHRNILQYKDDLICLDRSIFLGKTDYEIEVEVNHLMNPNLKLKLKGFNIDFNELTDGKMTRFLKRKYSFINK